MLKWLLWHALYNALSLLYPVVAVPTLALHWASRRLDALMTTCERRIRRGF